MHGTPLRRGTLVVAFVFAFLLPGRWAWGQG